MSDDLTLYDCEMIKRQFADAVDPETGEIPTEAMEALIKANTTSLAKMEGLCKYLCHLDHYVAMGKSELDRIGKLVKAAQNRQKSIKKFLTPYVDAERQRLKRPVEAGMFRLSTRRSQSVTITDPTLFELGAFPNESRKKVFWEPDKEQIKAYIKEHDHHPGAELTDKTNLVIK